MDKYDYFTNIKLIVTKPNATTASAASTGFTNDA
jgi:hypothetical protein|tara:strand:+ start:62 stop:163 length:102 start_codon:yes stop_codon:yes gene_type:complete